MWGYFSSCPIKKKVQGPGGMTVPWTQVELGHRAGVWEEEDTERERRGKGGEGGE